VRLDFGDVADCNHPPTAGAAGARVAAALPVQPIGERRVSAPLQRAQIWGTGLHAWLEGNRLWRTISGLPARARCHAVARA
jgi:ATP-dependent helicase/nuclease subunit A